MSKKIISGLKLRWKLGFEAAQYIVRKALALPIDACSFETHLRRLFKLKLCSGHLIGRKFEDESSVDRGHIEDKVPTVGFHDVFGHGKT